MDNFISIINMIHARIALGIIMAGTIASPCINGFVNNMAWLWAGCVVFAVVLTTVAFGFNFEARHKKLIWILIGGFAAVVIYIYWMWGKA